MEEKENSADNEQEEILPVSSNPLEFRTSQLEDVLNEKLEQAFHKNTAQVILHEVAKIAIEYDPIDLAHAVTRLPPSARIVLYDNLPDLQAKIIFMINTGNQTRTAIFKQLDDSEIKRLIEGMPPAEAVWVLDDLSDRRLKRILDLLDPKKAARIRELQKHDRHSAGRLMTNEFFAFPINTTIGEVVNAVHNNPGTELTGRIFVLNDEGELVGFVPERNLLINPSFLPIRQVMRPILHMITPNTSRDEVVDLVERYNIPALPVVDDENHLVGVISYEDAVEAMKDIADETIANIGGTGEEFGEYQEIHKRLMWRAPWLLVTLCGGLITASAMSYFNDRLWFIIVPFFVPLIAGMSGNVGLQCSTILVRAMATGTLTTGSIREAIAKEMSMGLLIGSIFGFACGFVVYLLKYFGVRGLGASPLALAVTVGFGIFAASMVATILGTLSPFLFARWRIDPAVASGPIVTAFNDVLSTLMFFLVARIVYIFLA